MKTFERRRMLPCLNGVTLLENGDHMTQAEFHRRYEQCPDDVKFELIGGIVYMASPLRWPHGNYHVKLSLTLDIYATGTPGLEAGDNATTILSDHSEPQPDLSLRILEQYGGQSRLNAEEYVEGAPELLAEIAYSSRSLDLNQKKEDYQKAGVLEYLVLSIEQKQIHWFHFPSGKMLTPNRQGIYRSKVFPGLWLDGQALVQRDSVRLQQIVQQGLASREHAAFVKRLERKHKQLS